MPRPRADYFRLAPSLLSAPTHSAFDRAVGRALAGLKGSAPPLRRAVATAMQELSAAAIDTTAALAHLNAIVENAGRGAPGDRMSLMSGQPRWMEVRDQVLTDARASLAPAPAVA